MCEDIHNIIQILQETIQREPKLNQYTCAASFSCIEKPKPGSDYHKIYSDDHFTMYHKKSDCACPDKIKVFPHSGSPKFAKPPKQ
jgi:hypothetical protein